MLGLEDTYRLVAHPRTCDLLAAHYTELIRASTVLGDASQRSPPAQPIAFVAAAVPPAAALNVAIHVLHAVPVGELGGDVDALLESAENNAAEAVSRCHRALELDGKSHSYSVEEWLPAIYEIAGQLLGSASLDQEPPTVAGEAQDAIGWLARIVVELNQDSKDAPSALAEALARLLTVSLFVHLGWRAPRG